MRTHLLLPLSLAIGGAAIMAVYRTLEVRPAAKPALDPSRGPSAPSGQELDDCPVTRPRDPAFVPPAPWPATPPDNDDYWFGTAGLWTALPNDGAWGQLAIGEKFWWWSEDYAADDVRTDSTPDLEVTATRLDGAAASFESTEATNGFHPSFNQAMLMGVQLPSPGCWQVEAEFGGSRLSFVVWVPGD